MEDLLSPSATSHSKFPAENSVWLPSLRDKGLEDLAQSLYKAVRTHPGSTELKLLINNVVLEAYILGTATKRKEPYFVIPSSSRA